ncbi:MAG: hypothetical protein U9O65_01505 [Thermotogota bacterium]|nr:hypothetical protein [Thermotogota bacterium]
MKKASFMLIILLFFSVVSVFGQELITTHLEFLRDEFKINDNSYWAYWIYADRLPDGSYRHVEAVGEGVTCVDDVARAGIFYLRNIEIGINTELSIERSKEIFEFLFAMQRNDGSFYNFITSDGEYNRCGPTSRPGPNWWSVRALWTLAKGANVFYEIDEKLSFELLERAKRTFSLLNKNLENGLLDGYTDISSVMLLGVCELAKYENNAEYIAVINEIAKAIVKKADNNYWEDFGLFDEGKDNFNWHGWGSRHIEALVESYLLTGNQDYLRYAERSARRLFTFIITFGPVYSVGENLVEFPKIAYAAECMVNSAVRLYEVTGIENYGIFAALMASWFKGFNELGRPMFGENGEGFDGLEPTHRNLNSGAESTISALLTIQSIHLMSEDFLKYYNGEMIQLSPGKVIEAEKLNLGLSDAEVVSLSKASGGYYIDCKGTTVLRGEIALSESDYEIFASFLENRVVENVEITSKIAQNKSSANITMSKGIIKAGTIKGTGEKERFSFGLKFAGERIFIDQIIFYPKLIAIYNPLDDDYLFFNRTDEKILEVEPFAFWEAKEPLIAYSGDGESVQESLEIEKIDVNGYTLLEMGPVFDNNGIIDSLSRKEGNFDNYTGVIGASYPEGEIKKLTENGYIYIENVPYFMNTEGNDNLRTTGQKFKIGLSAGRLYVLGSSDHGDYTDTITIFYEDGATEYFNLSFSDWCGSSQFGEKTIEFPYRYDIAGNIERIKCKLYVQSFELEDKVIESIQLPNTITMHIFAITFEY